MMKAAIYKTCSACFAAVSLLLVSCQKDVSGVPAATANLTVQFKAVVDAEPWTTGKTYKNGFGEDYSVTAFKFYLHAVELTNSQTNTVAQVDRNNHYLIDVGDAAASFFKVDVPAATYNRISFIVGVDSARNVSGAQTGALDPGKGMFWTWSTGYIMAKLEGNSPLANTPNHSIEYHIGGFKGSESVLRKVTLTFPVGQLIDLTKKLQSTVMISANINAWFNSTKQVRISQTPVTMTPGKVASDIADNYSQMFTVSQIVNE